MTGASTRHPAKTRGNRSQDVEHSLRYRHVVRSCLVSGDGVVSSIGSQGLTLRSLFPLLSGRSPAEIGVLANGDALAADLLTPAWIKRLAGVSGRLFSGHPIVALFPPVLLVLELPLAFEDFDTRAANALSRAGLTTWGQLAVISPDELLGLPNFGETSLQSVLETAARTGLMALVAIAPVELEPTLDWEGDAESSSAVRVVGDLVPGLADAVGDALLPRDLLPTRLANLNVATTWTELLALPIQTLQTLPSIGTKSLRTLVERIKEVAEATRQAEARPEFEDVREFLVGTSAWARQDKDVVSLGAILKLSGGDLPPSLRAKWRSLADRPLKEPSAKQRVAQQIGDLLDGLDDREKAILEKRVWPVSDRATLEEVGQLLGMTRERVRQIETGIVNSFSARLDEDDFQFVRFRADEISQRLGTTAPADSDWTISTLRWAGRDMPPELRAAAVQMLVWVAGPYRNVGGWWCTDEAPDRKGDHLRALATAGFVSDEVVESEMDRVGVHPQVRETWLTDVGQFVRVDGGWLDARGSIVDQALRYLAFKGVPMTTEEILAGIGRDDATTRSVRQRLFDDPRAVRVSKTEIGLPEWGHNEYTSLAEEMLEELERRGGRAPLHELIEALVDTFGVSANSVRMYAGRPMFLLDDEGCVQVRPADQPYEIRDDLFNVASCYELSPTRACWRLVVDGEVKRGSGRHIPEQLAGWLRLRPGNTAAFAHPTRPVTLAWRAWGQPDISSLKPVAEDLKCEIGDWLVLVFDRAGSVSINRVRKSEDSTLPALGRLIGLEDPHDLESIARALGVGTDDDDSLRFRVRAALQARKDVDIMELADKVLLG